MDHLSLPHRRSGFTLLEIMIAIGIIVILAGILIMGGNTVMKSSREKATKVSLASVQGMFAEFDAKTGLSKPPAMWLWNQSGTLKIVGAVDTPTINTDFWRRPGMTGSAIFETLDAPGVVMDSNVETRNGSKAVINTQIVMNYLMAMPANRDALQKLRPEQYMIPEFQTSDKKVRAGGNDGVLHTSDDADESIGYVTGSRVQYNGQRFLCKKQIILFPDTPVDTTPPGGDWVADNGPAAPVMLDAWGNPIIFVPGTGLRVRLLNGEKELKTDTSPESLKQTWIIVSPEGKVKDNGTGAAPPVVTQPGRPFFASAGPDGDFAKGDDNIYSFQK